MIFSQTIKPDELKDYAGLISKEGFKLEIMLDSSWINQFSDKNLIDGIKRQWGESIISSHAPHHSLNIGSKDKTIRDYSIKQILSAVEISAYLGAEEIIFHSTFMPLVPSKIYEAWLELSDEGFYKIASLCKELGIMACIENTYEKDERLISDLLNKYPSMSFCFDAGHVNTFSDLSLDVWLKKTASRIKVLHIHDNAGDEDAHLDIFEGNIEFKKIIEAVDVNSVRFNLETDIENFLENSKKLKELTN
jgi:sugar phosphate isomerase/epimerase